MTSLVCSLCVSFSFSYEFLPLHSYVLLELFPLSELWERNHQPLLRMRQKWQKDCVIILMKVPRKRKIFLMGFKWFSSFSCRSSNLYHFLWWEAGVTQKNCEWEKRRTWLNGTVLLFWDDKSAFAVAELLGNSLMSEGMSVTIIMLGFHWKIFLLFSQLMWAYEDASKNYVKNVLEHQHILVFSVKTFLITSLTRSLTFDTTQEVHFRFIYLI